MRASVIWQDQVGIIFGFIFILIGLAYFFSPRFAEIAFEYTAQGAMWKKLVGEKWAPFVAKFFFSFVSIALGIYVIYHIIYGYD
jgi:hypothetical protein